MAAPRAAALMPDDEEGMLDLGAGRRFARLDAVLPGRLPRLLDARGVSATAYLVPGSAGPPAISRRLATPV